MGEVDDEVRPWFAARERVSPSKKDSPGKFCIDEERVCLVEKV